MGRGAGSSETAVQPSALALLQEDLKGRLQWASTFPEIECLNCGGGVDSARLAARGFGRTQRAG